MVLAAVFAIGGLSGLLVAWSQEARMCHWAGKVHRATRRALAAVERAEIREESRS